MWVAKTAESVKLLKDINVRSNIQGEQVRGGNRAERAKQWRCTWYGCGHVECAWSYTHTTYPPAFTLLLSVSETHRRAREMWSRNARESLSQSKLKVVEVVYSQTTKESMEMFALHSMNRTQSAADIHAHPLFLWLARLFCGVRYLWFLRLCFSFMPFFDLCFSSFLFHVCLSLPLLAYLCHSNWDLFILVVCVCS